jgi:hypothetical protein
MAPILAPGTDNGPVSLGPPRGLITPEQAARLPDVEPPPRRARRRGQPRRRVQNYRTSDSFDRKLRLAILLRDNMRCQLCGVGLTLVPGQPHSAIAGHVLARWRGGAPTAENGRAECLRCSARGGGQERLLSGPARPAPRRPARPEQVPSVW